MKKFGIPAFYIDSNNFIDNFDDDTINVDNALPIGVDPIRYYSKNIWTRHKRKLILAKEKSPKTLFDVETAPNNVLILKANKEFFYTTYFENGILRKEYTDSSADLWENYVNNVVPSSGTIFEDTYLQFDEPINLAEVRSPQASNLAYINNEFLYNFYAPKFEALVNSPIFRIKTLPTPYNLIVDSQVDTRQESENLVLSLGGFIPENTVNQLFFAKTPDEGSKQYFETYADTYVKPEVAPVLVNINSSNTFVDISKQKTNLAKQFRTNFAPFPFYTYVEFSNYSPDKNDLIHVMDDLNAVEEQLLAFINGRITNPTKNFIYASKNIEEKTLEYFDLKLWFDSALQNNTATDDVIEPDTAVIYTKLLDYINKTYGQNIRNYEDFTSKTVDYQVLFYKIEKRQFNHNSNVLQTFYITPDESEIVKFFDSQIKYGVEFYYSIKAVCLITGNKYYYEPYNYANDLEILNDKLNGLYKIKINTKPTYRILELEMGRFSGAIIETPYTKPVFDILNEENKVRFNFRQPSLSSLETFQSIENGEFELFDLIRRSQGNEESDKIKSQIDTETSKKLQIYRINEYPNSFLSFQKKLYKTVTLTDNKNTFLDILVDNIPYYYLFRFLNKHDIPSNVSQIYKVLINAQNGFRQLEVEPISLQENIVKKDIKEMRKYFLIRPSTIQIQPQYEEDVKNIDDIAFGPYESVWNKQFLIRLTSKKTNRIIEFRYTPTINKKKQ